jgi:hypothetical protein
MIRFSVGVAIPAPANPPATIEPGAGVGSGSTKALLGISCPSPGFSGSSDKNDSSRCPRTPPPQRAQAISGVFQGMNEM